MKNQTSLGDLDLQVAFNLPNTGTIYRTLTYPTRLANTKYGNRSCLNLTTNKAVNLACNQEVVLVPVNSEVSESSK